MLVSMTQGQNNQSIHLSIHPSCLWNYVGKMLDKHYLGIIIESVV